MLYINWFKDKNNLIMLIIFIKNNYFPKNKISEESGIVL